MKKLTSLLTIAALCISLLSGCVFPIGNVTEPVDDHEITVMQLTLEKAENPVCVRIDGSTEFEGLRDYINGSTVARSQVGTLLAKCMSESTGDADSLIDNAFEDAYDECVFLGG